LPGSLGTRNHPYRRG